jgi:hypothetical protein
VTKVTERQRGFTAVRGRRLIAACGFVALAVVTTIWLALPSPEPDPPAVPQGIRATTTTTTPEVSTPAASRPTTLPATSQPAPTAGATTVPAAGRGGARTTPPPRPRTPLSPTPPSPARSTVDPLLGVLQRVDPLPEGVPAQVSFFFGGGMTCAENGTGTARIELHSASVIPTEFLLCFLSFKHSLPLTVTIAPPAGPATVVTLPKRTGEDEGFWYRSPRLPGHPTGTYRVTAHQPGTEVTARFTVTRATKPRLWLDRPYERPGVDVHMYLGGFPPRSTVALNLYAAGQGYRTSFPARTDAQGGGHVVLRTAAGDPSGCYGVSHPDLGDGTDPEDMTQRMSDNVFCV